MNGFVCFAAVFVAVVGIALCNRPGSLNQISADDADAVRLARYAVENSGTGYTFVRVKTASKQVVGGMRYELVVVVRTGSGGKKTCEVHVTERSWENKIVVGRFQCSA